MSCQTIGLKQKCPIYQQLFNFIAPYLGLFKLKFINLRSKLDLFSIVLHPILNGGKMRFRPAIFYSHSVIFLYDDRTRYIWKLNAWILFPWKNYRYTQYITCLFYTPCSLFWPSPPVPRLEPYCSSSREWKDKLLNRRKQTWPPYRPTQTIPFEEHAIARTPWSKWNSSTNRPLRRSHNVSVLWRYEPDNRNSPPGTNVNAVISCVISTLWSIVPHLRFQISKELESKSVIKNYNNICKGNVIRGNFCYNLRRTFGHVAMLPQLAMQLPWETMVSQKLSQRNCQHGPHSTLQVDEKWKK
jgi:hypothetical protein